MRPGSRRRGRVGFTLVELLVVLLIVAIIAGVTLPVVIPAISHRQVSESARIIQGGLVVARDAALRSNTPHGIRFLPDPTYNGLDPATGGLNPFRTLASNRFVPIEQPSGYSEGKVWVDPADPQDSANRTIDPAWFVNPLQLNAAKFSDAEENTLYLRRRILMVMQAVFTVEQTSKGPIYAPESPTSWYWNVRIGDKIRINNQGPLYTVVGPMFVPNTEFFTNVDPDARPLSMPHPDGSSPNYSPEILFVVDGMDGDEDGYVDNGMDGIDNDMSGVADDFGEFCERENWPQGFGSNAPSVVGRPAAGVPYQIVRQPVPSPGARETILPESVVVDLTGWALDQPERSRLPVDPFSGNVDILLDPGGRVIPTTRYSSPTSVGMGAGFYHIWVGERSDLAELIPDGSTPPVAASLVSGFPFKLPMPLGQNAETLTENANSYDALVEANPTLPTLKGEMRLLTLSARSGNLITTDRPTFSVTNPSQPFRAPQMGIQGDAP